MFSGLRLIGVGVGCFDGINGNYWQRGFRTPATTSYHVLRRPAFEKRQGTKSREVRSVGRAAGSAMGI